MTRLVEGDPSGCILVGLEASATGQLEIDLFLEEDRFLAEELSSRLCCEKECYVIRNTGGA